MASKSDPFPQEQQTSHVAEAFKTCARGAAIIAALVGCLGILGWMFNVPVLKHIRVGLAAIEPDAALAFALSGLTLWLRCSEQVSPRARRVADVCAFAVLLIGLLTLLEYAAHRDLGIGQLLMSRVAGFPGAIFPGRMAPSSAVLFVAVGLALFLLDVEDRRGRRPAQFLLILVGLYALAALISYLYSIIAPKQDTLYSSPFWPMALTFDLIALGALCARPERGSIRVVTMDTIGGDVARRLLPAAVAVPPFLCILCYLGFAARWYDAGFGLALLTTLNSAVFTTLIWRTAGTLHQTDAQRRYTEFQRNQLNEALQQAHAFHEKVMDSAVFAVAALDLEGRFTLVNRRMAEITGYTVASLIGQPFTMLLPADSQDQIVENLRRTLEEGTPLYHTETPLLRKDGATVTVAYGWSALFSEGKIIGIVGTGEDITERKRLEEQLFQARKMESVGRLAGGVAHDFNNLLTAILGYTELLEAELPDESRLTNYLHNIRVAGERAAGLTSQLLAFARRQVIEPKLVNLNTLILNLEALLQRLIGEHIQLVMQPAPDLHSVCVDPNQFEQILINLVVNARDAIPIEGGRITVETSNVTLDTEYANQHEGVTPGEYVMLAVSDTGSGMEEGIRLHIFEPFFTTKEKGRGTGLGLATVYGIVKQAGGHIWLYSEVGTGTTFKIYLPRASEPAEAMVPADSSPAPVYGTETVLVVEDEIAVRTLTTEALRGLGYHVLEAANGTAALQISEEYTGEIALLITDVVMPQMSGKELAERLLSARPTLKVLYVSGYTENTIVHHGVLEPGIAFLPKPFTLSALSLKVREVLNTS
ncbi:MAG TPA: PAS domain S-box protein [Chthonomonadaceae bacterium]|nr:PAS domain S-box protein [Chthonomonadaceae bacterium]